MASSTGPREYIRFEIIDFHGKALSKTVPARHRNSRVAMYAGALAYGANAEVIVFPKEVEDAGLPNAPLLPDWTTLQELPWASGPPERGIRVKRVYCEQGAAGQDSANEAVPRAICRRLLEELRGFGHQGLELMAGGEVEFTLCRPSSQQGGGWEPHFSGVDIFATLQNNKAMDFCYEVERCLDEVGVDVLTVNAEYGPGQVEIAFAPKLGLEACDAAATFRTCVKEIAQQRGLLASFMGKPFGVDGPGNGGHFNFSLWAGGGRSGPAEAGDAVLRASGGRTNVFHSTADPDGISPTARSFLAGVLAHAPALEAIFSPTPSCYLRRGRWAPKVANWGLDDRRAYVRVKAGGPGGPAACYMELRAPSAAANAYLVTAAVAACGLDGLERGLPLPAAGQSQEDGAVALPAALPEALAALEADELLVSKLGTTFVRWFTQVKRAELEALEARLASRGHSGGELSEERSEAWRHLYLEFV